MNRRILSALVTAIVLGTTAWLSVSVALPHNPRVRDAVGVFTCVALLGKGLYDTLFYDHYRP